jgi:hypothetical protein
MTLLTGHRPAPIRTIPTVSAAVGLLLAAPLYAGTLRGYLESVEGNTLVVGERIVELSPSTRVERRDDPGFTASGLRPGFEVEVKIEGSTARVGTLTAKRLKVLTKPSEPIKVEGFVERIEERSLRVDGWSIQWPQGLVRDDVKLGMDLAGEGELHDDGTVRLHAWKIRARQEDPGEREFLAQVANGMADFREKLKHASDPTLQEYVTRVGMRVAPDRLKQTEGALAFYVVNHDEPNAFALPDGTIVVHSGLLDVLANEAQLAFVLGHEIAHVAHGHAYLSRKRGRRLGIVTAIASTVASGVASVLLRDSGASDLFDSLNDMGSDLILLAAVNGYSRDLEDEADRIGLAYAFDGGYDPYQSVEVWRSLSRQVKDQGRVSNWFFGNHSTHKARIANLTKELNKHYRLSTQPGTLARNENEYQAALQRRAAAEQQASLRPREADATGCMAGDISLERGGDVDRVDELGNTVLMRAVQTCPLPAIRRLVDLGVNANPKPNAQDFTPLGLALVSGKWDVAEFLVERGARLRTSQIDALFFERPTDSSQLAILERAEQKEASR